MSIEWVRKNYSVPAKVGGRVEYTGGKMPCLGTITGARGGHLLIKLDGDFASNPYHPTWELRYLEHPSPTPKMQGVDIPRLPIGTAVEKVGGYPFPGTIVATFHTLAGQERFVVEATGEHYAGMLHIFNGGQLRALSAPATEVDHG